MSNCDFLFIFHSDCVPILYVFETYGQKSQIFPPHVYLVPRFGVMSNCQWIFINILVVRKPDSTGCHAVSILHGDTCYFDRKLECDWEKNSRTDRHWVTVYSALA